MKSPSLSNSPLMILAAAGAVALFGCVEPDDSTDTQTQQITGELSSDSDSDADLVAVDDSGTLYLFETEPDGSFHLELPAGHTYELYASEDGVRGLDQAHKLVFPRVDGDVDQQIDIAGQMEPFELGDVGSADSLESAEFQVQQAEDSGQPDDSESMECDEGAAGLFCIHDGLHPGCEGLSVAADRAAGAQDQATEGFQLAEQARQAADQAIEADGDSAPDIPEFDDSASVDPDQPIALSQYNPPAQFPGCSD